MKQKLTKEDISCLLYILNQKLDGCYCIQIYDGNVDNTRKVIFKFRYKSEIEVKFYYLVIESGIQMHVVEHFESVRHTPASLVSKLRKSFKEKRLWPIVQLNNDNIIDFRFSNDHHFIVELYDKGNFIITDENYIIYYLIRSYEWNSNKIEVKQTYPIQIKNTIFDEYKEAKGYMIPNTTFSGKPIDGENVIIYNNLNEALVDYFKINQPKKEKDVKKKAKNNQHKRNENKKKNMEAQIEKLTHNEEKLMNKGDYFVENIHYYQNIIDYIKNYINYSRNFDELNIVLCKLYQKDIFINHEKIIIDDYELDYSKSAFENISFIYQQKKQVSKKKEKAIDLYQHTKFEKKEITSIEKIDIKRKINKFEEYKWCFIDGFLVQCGKSADENEKLLSHCDKDDVLIHGHFDKSPWTIVKNPNKKEIPIKVLDYGGQFLVHHSWNWDENCTNQAYYTYPDKVSKTAPSGEFMGKGSRMVHQKNILSNADMSCALAILFSVNNGTFTGNPKLEDIIDYALIMCGPYQSCSNFIFKMKLRPSGTKKDKGRKKLLEKIKNNFMKIKIKNEKLKSYIKAIPHDEWDKICIHYFILS